MSNTSVSGLDMMPTIQWYAENAAALLRCLPRPASLDGPPAVEFQEDGGRSILTRRDINGLMALFPESARTRSGLQRIVVKPAAWFHRDSGSGLPKLTHDAAEALSSTAIIPSMITYNGRVERLGIASTIVLFDLTPHGISPAVQRIIHAQAFVHEFGHSIVAPELYGDFGLCVPDGTQVSGGEHLLGFQDLANATPPISHYASAYYAADGKLMEMPSSPLTPLSEVVVETIAAILLGFAFRLDGNGLNPFQDREPQREFIERFLNASRVA